MFAPSSDTAPSLDAQRQQARLLHAYQGAFGTASGQIVLADLLREGGLLAVCHEPGDSHHTAFLDGKRALALHVLEKLRWTEAEILTFSRRRTSDALADPKE